ncbi:MAG: hypothetical protein JWQ96_3543 [Segetibacter sp.]|nr:hypothetical protein [Segetibacter sp.]
MILFKTKRNESHLQVICSRLNGQLQQHLQDEFSQKKRVAAAEGVMITYEEMEEGSFVLSGLKGKRKFYQKTIVTNTGLATCMLVNLMTTVKS